MDQGDLRRIAFVTRRFGALQGLRTVSYGAALIFGVVAYAVLPDDFHNPIQVLVTAQLLSGAAATRVDEYYRHCFGRVGVPQRGFGGRPGVSPGQALHLIAAMAIMLDVLKAAFLPVSVTGISVAGPALIAGSLWILVRDWPHRAHYMIPMSAGAATVVIVASAPMRRPDTLLDPAVGVYYVLACGVIGLSLLAASLLDHWLLTRAMSAPRAERQPALSYFGGLRAALAGTVLAVVATCIAVWGWPPPAVPVMVILWSVVPLLAVALSYKDMFWGLHAYQEMERAREAALIARMKRSLARAAGLPEEPPDAEVEPTNVPEPDFVGHVALPITMAAGALLDAGLHGSGLPSFLALGLALSHGRIALRDWPVRGHYVTGAFAALVAAGFHMKIDRGISAFEWAILSLTVVSGAMLIEGLLDRRLESHPRPQFSDDRHAHTI